MARNRTGVCPYCVKRCSGLEEEHVFPDSWYPSTTPAWAKRITVAACSTCNREYGRIEERLLRTWALCIDSRHEAAQGVWERVRRSLDPSAGHSERDVQMRAGLKAKVRRSIHPAAVSGPGRFPGSSAAAARWARLPSGVIALAADSLDLAARDVIAFTTKLVRGLHQLHHGTALALDVPIATYAIGEESWAEHLPRIESMTRRGVPPGFAYWHAVAAEEPSWSLWYFLIWGQVFLQASTSPAQVNAAPPPQSQAGRPAPSVSPAPASA